MESAALSLINPEDHTRLEGVAYDAYARYHGSTPKTYANLRGIYGYLGLGKTHALEGEVDYTRLDYDTLPRLRQWDATLAYANFSLPHVKLRAGVHYVTSDDRFTDQGRVFFAGMHYYQPLRWDAGADAYCRYTYFLCDQAGNFIRHTLQHQRKTSPLF